MQLYLCLPLFVVLGPFWAVFNFAHLELGYEYQPHKNEIPPDLKYHYEVIPGKKVIGKDLSYDS